MTANVALKCNAGDIAWLAIQCVTSLLCSLGNECGGSGNGNGNGGDNEVGYQASGSAAIIEPVSVLIDGTTFASSIAALRHFVRRFPGSRAVLNIALEGYVFLSDTILITPYGNDDNDVDTKIDHVRRRALFSSLGRGALPFVIRSEISWYVTCKTLYSLITFVYCRKMKTKKCHSSLIITNIECSNYKIVFLLF